MVRQTMKRKANPVPESSPFAGDSPQHWIVKFAPFRTSWSEIVRAGNFTLRGVRSAEARRNLSQMQLGDLVLFYQSQQQQAIVGLMRVSRAAYSDPTSSDPRWLTCDFTPVRSLHRPVTLREIRHHLQLRSVCLIRQPRLPVGRIDLQTFDAILTLAAEP
jgi:predicted RNA-binding protein with PUA-like domain